MVTDKRRRFEALMLPHLDAALGLARWLSRSNADAEDIAQEAFLRAFRLFDGFRGERAKPWLLTIVRNCYRNHTSKLRSDRVISLEDTTAQGGDTEAPALEPMAPEGDDPENAAIRSTESAELNAAIARLPLDYREVLVLREIEDLSYREIAEITAVPIGTVMSRLSRAREALRSMWLANPADRAAS
jgi:RNA polymerase sigma factor (sigma-70 family)